MLRGFGVDRAAVGALSLVLLAACSGSGQGAGGSGGSAAGGARGSTGGTGGSETFTPFPDCLPPCLETALTACIGNSTVCSTSSTGICWDTGTRATLTVTPIDAGVQEQDEVIYAPDGGLCLTGNFGGDAL